MNEFASESTVNSYAPDLLLHPIHITMHLRFNLEKKSLDAQVIHTVIANAEARTLQLNGVGFFDVNVEILDHPNEKIEWRYDGEIIYIVWEKALQPEEQRRVKVSYRVENPITGMAFCYPDQYYPKNPAFAATDHETERARFWLACVDYPSIRTTLEFYITSAKEYTILANGLLQSETENGDGTTKTAHWKLDQVCPSYLVCVAVGDFHSVKDGDVHNVPLEYFSTKDMSKEDLMRSFCKTRKIMTWLENKLGTPFPYPKYFQLVFPKKGGAMENISLTTWDPFFLLDETWEKENRNYTDMINCHEMTHSYFGNAIGMRHFEHAWLKESWASYMQYCWMEHDHGKDEFLWELYKAGESYFEECEDYVRPIVCKKYDHSWHLFDHHLYPGGAWRLHMLRKSLGDSLFWKAVGNYVSTYLHKLVETDDFRRILEKFSHKNLTKFFDQWIYGVSYPKLKGNFSYDGERKEITLKLEQIQVDSKKNIQAFDLELDVMIIDSNGGVHMGIIKFKEAHGSLVMTVPSKPAQLLIDPDNKILFSLDLNPGQDILQRVAKVAPNIFHRIWAIKELSIVGSTGNIVFINEAMKSEPFYGVRMEAAKFISKNHSTLSIEVLCEMLKREQHADVQTRIVTLLKDVKLPMVEQALLSFVKMKNIPYKGEAAALEGLGHYGEHFELLKAKATAPDFILAIVRSGAMRGISNLHTIEAYNFLKQRVNYEAGEQEYLRSAIIASFAESVRWLEPKYKSEAISILINILRQHEWGIPRTNFSIIQAFVTLEAEKAIPYIEAAKRRFSVQAHKRIDAVIKAIKKANMSTTAKLQKELEELKRKVKDMETK